MSKDIFADLNIGIILLASSIILFSLSEKPVVAITIGILFVFAYLNIFKVATGREKSIITSGFTFISSILLNIGKLELLEAVLSKPAIISNSSFSFIKLQTTCPIFPLQPFTNIFII